MPHQAHLTYYVIPSCLLCHSILAVAEALGALPLLIVELPNITSSATSSATSPRFDRSSDGGTSHVHGWTEVDCSPQSDLVEHTRHSKGWTAHGARFRSTSVLCHRLARCIIRLRQQRLLMIRKRTSLPVSCAVSSALISHLFLQSSIFIEGGTNEKRI